MLMGLIGGKLINFGSGNGLVLPVGGCSKVVATFKNLGGSFNLFMATIGDVWIIQLF